MPGTPLTKPLHNGSVQIGTGVSCMRCKRGSSRLASAHLFFQPMHHHIGCISRTGHVLAARARRLFWLLQAPHTAKNLQPAKKHNCELLAPVLISGARSLLPPWLCRGRNQPEPCRRRYRFDSSQKRLPHSNAMKCQQMGTSVVRVVRLARLSQRGCTKIFRGNHAKTLSGLHKASRLSCKRYAIAWDNLDRPIIEGR